MSKCAKASIELPDGRVYAKGKYVRNSTMTQATVGLQTGGADYSEIVFFQDERAFKEFTSGNFEFGAGKGRQSGKYSFRQPGLRRSTAHLAKSPCR
jgi:hypothetical protein